MFKRGFAGFFKAATMTGVLFLLYSANKESKMADTVTMQERIERANPSGAFQLEEKKKKTMIETENYLASHAGYSEISILRNADFFQIRLLTVLEEKQKELNQLRHQDPAYQEKKIKLNAQIQQIRNAYEQIKEKQRNIKDFQDKEPQIQTIKIPKRQPKQ